MSPTVLPLTSAEDEELELANDARAPRSDNMNVVAAITRTTSHNRAMIRPSTTVAEPVRRGRKRGRPESPDAGDSEDPSASSTLQHRQIARQPRIDPGELSEDRLSELSKTTTLPIETVEPELPVPKQGWFGSISRSFASDDGNVPKLELNPLGEITFNFREKARAEKQQKTQAPKIIQRVRCARQSTREAAKGHLWHDLLSAGKTIDVPLSDDQFGLLFVLRAAHGMDLSKDYPTELSFEDIIKIAKMVHKYDASKEVRQAVVARMPARFKNDPDHFIGEPNGELWLFVAWTFGFTESFVRHLRHMIRDTCVDATQQIVDVHGKALTGTFPSAIIHYVKEKREEYLEKLLDVSYEWASQLSSPDLQICFAPDRHRKHNCAALMAGSFVRGLKKMGLDGAQPAVEDVKLSIDSLEKHLKGIKGHQPQSDAEWNPNASDIPDVHPNCQQKAIWHFLVNRELAGIDEVPIDFLRYLAHQYEKLTD